MASTNYYDFSALNYRNTIAALDIVIETFYANLLFKGDATRIIYSDTSNALRKRAKNQDWNTLYLPFMNYHLEVVNTDTDRQWWNHMTNISGVWSEELQRKLRLAPIKLKYESSVFVHRDDDNKFAMQETIFDFSNETLFKPNITITDEFDVTHNVELLAVLGYNLDFDPTYVDKDWFEQNRIHSITLDFEFDYWYVKDKTTGFGIPDEVIFNWGRMVGLDDTLTVDEIYTFFIDRTHETVIPT